MKLKLWVKVMLYIIALYALILLAPVYPIPVLIAGFILLSPALIVMLFIAYEEVLDRW